MLLLARRVLPTLDGRGNDLNTLLGAVNAFAPHGGDVVRILHRDRDAAARLVVELGGIAQSIGDRGTAIDTIASRGLVALDALRDRDDALAESLNELPPTLTDVEEIVDTIGTTTDRALPVARNLTGAVTDLRPVVADLAPSAGVGRGVLDALGGASPGLRRVLDEATETSKVLPDALPALRKTLCQVHPMVRYIDPYMPEALHILMGLGSASNAYDATGHTIRLAPIVALP